MARRRWWKRRNGSKAPKTTARRKPQDFFDRVFHADLANRDAAATKVAEAARKKAEKDALLKEEEASLPSKPSGKKAPTKKAKGLDLSGLDAPSSKKDLAALNATGIDNAIDALSLTANSQDKIDRHPERRFKAAYAAYEERRLEEMKDEKGLRRQQRVDQIRKEFEKHPDNPFNQTSGQYNMSKEEIKGMRGKREGEEGGDVNREMRAIMAHGYVIRNS